ncbi:MAG TPA: MBL fold metallo-hydrolase [Candidatus Obscuribacterales bacterium]
MTKREMKRITRTGEALVKLHVLGSAEQVTGSMMLFEYTDRERTTRFLLDAGMTVENEKADFQNRLPSGITPQDIDFVVISHAHIDHSGYLPRLYKLGFKGPVYTTHATRDLLEIMLPDSGFLQEEAARRANERALKMAKADAGEGARSEGDKEKSGKEGRRKTKDARLTVARVEPLYTQRDAQESLSLIRGIEYDVRKQLAPEIFVTFTEAGHILGAAVVNLEMGSGKSKRTFCFTGNIGRARMPLLKDVAPVKAADYVMSESTYGNRLHEKRDRLEVLAGITNRAYERALKGSTKHGAGLILFPAFAVGRAQTVLNDLRQLMADGRIPEMKIYVDSPMTIRATEVHRRHRELLNAETRALFAKGIDPFRTPGLVECMERAESEKLDQPMDKPAIIIGSSGMASGGRIVRHLLARLSGRQNTVVFVGYQGTGTLGQQLIGKDARTALGGTTVEPAAKHVRTVRIYGQPVKVYATIEFMSDYSAHGDYGDIIGWLSRFERRPKKTFLVHGDEDAMASLKARIEKVLAWDVSVPKPREVFIL